MKRNGIRGMLGFAGLELPRIPLRFIQATVTACSVQVARKLGVSRKTIYNRMQRYAIAN